MINIWRSVRRFCVERSAPDAIWFGGILHCPRNRLTLIKEFLNLETAKLVSPFTQGLDIQDLLQGISNPSRRKILQMLWDDELPSGDIAARFDVTWSAVSQNLRVLNDAGLLCERRVGTTRYYRVDRKAAAPIEHILRTMWMEDLRRLKRVIEADK